MRAVHRKAETAGNNRHTGQAPQLAAVKFLFDNLVLIHKPHLVIDGKFCARFLSYRDHLVALGK